MSCLTAFYLLDICYEGGYIWLFGYLRANDNRKFPSACIRIAPWKSLYLPLKNESISSLTNETLNEELQLIKHRLNLSKFDVILTEKKLIPHIHKNTESDIPRKFCYVLVNYSELLPSVVNGNSIFEKKNWSAIEGIMMHNQNIVEDFLLRFAIKGPCWMSISYKENDIILTNDLVRCESLINCSENNICVYQPEALDSIGLEEIPPINLEVLSLKLRSHHEQPDLIYVISMTNVRLNLKTMIERRTDVFETRKHTTFLFNSGADNIEKINLKDCKMISFPDEGALLDYFLAYYNAINPDVIIGYDLLNFILQKLILRSSFHNINHSYGKFKKSYKWSAENLLNIEKLKYKLFPGVLLFDIKQCSAEFLKKSELLELDEWLIRYGDYPKRIRFEKLIPILIADENERVSMNEVISHLVNVLTEEEVTLRTQFNLFLNKSWMLITFLISKKSGLPWKQVMIAPEVKRSEYLLLFECVKQGYVPPLPLTKEAPNSFSFQGGINLEPLSGIHQGKTILIDANHLYPACIVEHNICFTSSGDILPKAIRPLIEEKKTLQTIIESPSIKKFTKFDSLEDEELRAFMVVVKLLMNKCYGSLAYKLFRFYSPSIASIITEKGREFLMKLKDHIETSESYCKILFGVTDSLCINISPILSDYESDLITKNIIQVANSLYENIAVKYETFSTILVSKRKNEYSALSFDEKTKTSKIVSKGFGQSQPFDLNIAPIISRMIRECLKEVLNNPSIRPEDFDNLEKRFTESIKSYLSVESNTGDDLYLRTRLTNPIDQYLSQGSLKTEYISALYALKNFTKLRTKPSSITYVPYSITLNGTEITALPRALFEDKTFKTRFHGSINNESFISQFTKIIKVIRASLYDTAPRKRKSEEIQLSVSSESQPKRARLEAPDPNFTYQDLAECFSSIIDFEFKKPQSFQCKKCKVIQITGTKCINQFCENSD